MAEQETVEAQAGSNFYNNQEMSRYNGKIKQAKLFRNLLQKEKWFLN